MKYALTIFTILFVCSAFGQLLYSITSDTIAYPPAPAISDFCTVEIENPTTSTIQFSVIRLENEVAPYWLSSICTSVDCYFTTVDSASVDILPGTTEEVKLYFGFYQNTTDTARALFLFRNENNPSNAFTHNFYGVDTTQQLSLKPEVLNSSYSIAPNPFSDHTVIKFSQVQDNEDFEIINSYGQIVRSFRVHSDEYVIEKETLSAGIYLLRSVSGKFPVQRLAIE